MTNYCVYTRDLVPSLLPALEQLATDREIHANRTRFYLDQTDPLHLAFYLKYSDIIHWIAHEQDHALGR